MHIFVLFHLVWTWQMGQPTEINSIWMCVGGWNLDHVRHFHGITPKFWSAIFFFIHHKTETNLTHVDLHNITRLGQMDTKLPTNYSIVWKLVSRVFVVCDKCSSCEFCQIFLKVTLLMSFEEWYTDKYRKLHISRPKKKVDLHPSQNYDYFYCHIFLTSYWDINFH